MGRGKRQNGTHHKVVSRSSVEETRFRLSVLVCGLAEGEFGIRWKSLNPRSALQQPFPLQLSIDSREMMDEAQVVARKNGELMMGAETEFGEREDSRALPSIDLGLNAGSPEQIRPFRSIIRRRTVHVIAPAVMLGAVTAAPALAMKSRITRLE